ncbi:TIGR03915 family putative DNA repair protein [Foetidibacter luteolus]|uniref:TIGR03915 family putative DNA repair protein n=1 Tax=Foetidibacter luteolus TaxID=2608880 RepID=UPI00129B74E1|nr:TIGR03915 family putative DNA repair protein [Foetidibacter luteolus]
MHTFIYNGSFEGWLTAVFEIYEYNINEEVVIVKDAIYQPSLLTQEHIVTPDDTKAKRVWNGLKQKLSPRALETLYHSFLSEDKGIENQMLQYARLVFSNKLTIEHNFSNSAILKITQTAQKVRRERHRMTAFVRFQLTSDGLYYALVEPDFNVLPLIIKHFKDRYADQRWLIYDNYRKYGIYYNLQTVEIVEIAFTESNASSGAILYDEKEALYQQLWQQYFSSVNIKARKNTKLHIQHMPVRYWKYLTEKRDFM